ncbi:hypothetical protein BKH41_07375 [Helicobacter sp. 12S02232-10]|uniref:DUF3240 family protein n=1 Tax=Helicobacter sp. 12S02232-10 TaxID=1476197 RepID=UPI000BA5B119|nr:DUF3240 family protein [Helicobacter sp. 12S02232-10]PAF47700.1 hypothetical protein BKH41_07375 [Helicobacter sp. 12S02232-10]
MALLEIYADTKLKDGIVDRLLEDGFDDFYYFECYKYAATSLLLSEKEQVSGRKDYGLFKMFVADAVGLSLAERIYELFGKTEVRILFYPAPKEL